MYKYLLPLVFLWSGSLVGAQCPIPNGNFEVWEAYQDTLGHELDIQLTEQVEFPTAWFPLEKLIRIIFSDFFTPYLFRDTMDVSLFQMYRKDTLGYQSGSALKLSGDVDFEISDAFAKFPCFDRPAFLRGYFKKLDDNPGLLHISVLLGPERLDFNTATGYGQIYIDQGSDQYQSFDIPIQYRGEEATEKAIIQIRALHPEGSKQQAAFYSIDQLQFPVEIDNKDELPHTQVETIIYPNPATYQLNIESQLEFKNATIYHVSGVPVREIKSVQKTVLLNGLPSGAYFITLDTGEELVSKQFLIQ